MRQLLYDRGQIPDLLIDLPPPSSSLPPNLRRNPNRITSSSRQRTKCFQKLSDLLHLIDTAFQQASSPPSAALLTFGPSHSSYKEQYLLRFASPIDSLSTPLPEPPEAILQKVSRRCMRSFVSCLHEEDEEKEEGAPPNYDFSHLLLALPGIHSFRMSLLANFSPSSSPPQELIARPRFSPRVLVPDVNLPASQPVPSPFRPFPVPPPPPPCSRRRQCGRPPLCVVDVFPLKPPPKAHLLTSQPQEDGEIWWDCKLVAKGWRDKS